MASRICSSNCSPYCARKERGDLALLKIFIGINGVHKMVGFAAHLFPSPQLRVRGFLAQMVELVLHLGD